VRIRLAEVVNDGFAQLIFGNVQDDSRIRDSGSDV